jgi:hypothetical protein
MRDKCWFRYLHAMRVSMSSAQLKTKNISNMNDNIEESIEIGNPTFPATYNEEDIRLEIETWKVDNNERIRCSHSAVIKKEAQSYQIATCLEITNEHTGELHHYAIEIHNIHRYKTKGWVYQEKYRIYDLNVFNALSDFLNSIKNGELGQENNKKYLVSEDEFQLLQRVNSTDVEIVQEVLENHDTYTQLLKTGGTNLMKDVLQLSIKQENTIELLQKFKEFDLETLRELNSLAGISQLKSVLELWSVNHENESEEFWQQTFNANSWVISQLFSHPVVLFAGKAYVGGKWIDNRGGSVTDYIFKNNLTDNVILIEIKTPKSVLLGGEYRTKVYSPSSELSGASIQMLNYKETLQREYANIIANNPQKPRFDVFNPKCLLIIGNFMEQIEDNYDKKRTFELFRANSREVEIITFDEIFRKIEILITLLEG